MCLWGRHVTLYACGLCIVESVMYEYPEIIPLFLGVGVNKLTSGPFNGHCMRVANAFDMVINLLADEETLNEALDHLSNQHRAIPGIRAEHMEVWTNNVIAQCS